MIPLVASIATLSWCAFLSQAHSITIRDSFGSQAEIVTAVSCRKALEPFYKDVENKCRLAIHNIQTCSNEPLSDNTMAKVAGNLIVCLENVTAHDSLSWQGAGSEGGVANGLYGSLFSSAFASNVATDASIHLIESKDACSRPEFIPVLKNTIEYFLRVDENCSAKYTESKYYSNWTTVYFGRPGEPETAILKTPGQYQRCAALKPADKVQDCVATSIAKLKWVIPDVFIWSGNDSCASTTTLYVTFVFKMIFEILEVMGAIWLRKRKEKREQQQQQLSQDQELSPYPQPAYLEHFQCYPKHIQEQQQQQHQQQRQQQQQQQQHELEEQHSNQPFSFSRLTFSLLQGLGVETFMAYLLYRDALAGFLPGLLVVFLFTPRPVPFTALLAGLHPLGRNKAWGLQMLLVDGMVVMLGAATLTPVPLGRAGGAFSLAPPPPSGEDKPAGFDTLYYGLFVTNYPAYLLLAAYLLVGLVLPFMAIVYVCLHLSRGGSMRGRENTRSRKAKACLKLFLLMILVLTYPFVVPILALAEVIFLALHWRDRKTRRFGPVRWADDLLQGTSERKMKVMTVLYWAWCLLDFVIFVGRWMVVVNLLAVAGDVFCPSSLGKVAGGGLGVTLGLVLANLGLQMSGLSY